jgi:two-component system response regulator AtoC
VEKRTVFVVDDDQSIQDFLFTFLTTRGYQVECFGSGDALFTRLPAGNPGLILLDLVMPGCDGIEVMQRILKTGAGTPVIMLSGKTDLRAVVEAMKLGALNFLMKPFEEEVLENIIKDVFDQNEVAASIPRHTASHANDGRDFLTVNPKMLSTAGIVRRVAYTDVPILILGESGVGKEVVARFAHRHSGRQENPFIKINCAAMPHDLLESELFGYERGAFTGAVNDKTGKFEQAHTGTLLLDEIGEMSAHLQSKLLHVLQDGTFSRLGSRKMVKVDVRIIAATNIKIENAIADGRFREDLYYRLNVVRVEVPALRDRLEDLPRLCSHFVSMYREKYRSSFSEIPSQLLNVFAKYHWPGNIRQLENIIKRFLLLGNWEEIADELCPQRPQTAEVVSTDRTPASLLSVGAAAAEVAERRLVQQVLEETRGNRKKAAQRLNISYKALLNKLKRWTADSSQPTPFQSNIAARF